MSTRRNLVQAIVVAAALLVPVAQADDWARDGIATSGVSASTHPDNRAAARGPGAIAAQTTTLGTSRPDDRGDARGPGAFPGTTVAEPAPNEFDWRDAMIGGLGGVGLALVLGGCVFLVLSQRGRPRVA